MNAGDVVRFKGKHILRGVVQELLPNGLISVAVINSYPRVVACSGLVVVTDPDDRRLALAWHRGFSRATSDLGPRKNRRRKR